MKSTADQLAGNLADIRRRIAAACARAGRIPDDVTLVAVTKYAQPEWVRELVAIGVRDLGESRPQQLLERAAWFDEAIRWHLIGPLQRNKARRMLSAATLIHSVDSLRLLESLQRLAEETAITPRVLLELNIVGEEAKHGFRPADLLEQGKSITACDRVRIAGLMTMAPYSDDPETARPVFRELRQLRDRLQEQWSTPLPELSMGMSGDFEVAIEEGATIVRIGSSLFEGLSAS